MALACDIIIAADHARLGLPEPRVGLMAGAGGVHRLPRVIPQKIAMGYILTGRHMTAQEAHRLGVVNEVVPLPELMPTAMRCMTPRSMAELRDRYGAPPRLGRLRMTTLVFGARCRTLAASIFDLAWLAEADQGRPLIFLAEGVFPYFCAAEVKPLLTALADRFPGAELVFDALSPLMAWVHNRTSSVLKESGTRIRWDVKAPADLEAWGLRLRDCWGYFDRPEPRLGLAGLIRFIPPLARATYILRYQLGGPAAS